MANTTARCFLTHVLLLNPGLLPGKRHSMPKCQSQSQGLGFSTIWCHWQSQPVLPCRFTLLLLQLSQQQWLASLQALSSHLGLSQLHLLMLLELTPLQTPVHKVLPRPLPMRTLLPQAASLQQTLLR